MKFKPNHFKFKQILKPSWLQIVGVFIICCGISLFSAMLHTVEVTSTAEVAEHWRGKYDILVRSESSVSDVERETQLVEGNYLGTSYGGITDEQYTLIKSIDDVEVAAPVATVGYFVNYTGSIIVRVDPWEENTLYQIRTKWLGDTPELQGAPEQYSYFAIANNARDVIIEGNLFHTLAVRANAKMAELVIGYIPSQWVLVAGIDPQQETQLIGLDEALIEGDYLKDEPLSPGWDSVSGKRVSKVPLIINDQTYSRLGVSIRIDDLPLEDITEVNNISSAYDPSDERIRKLVEHYTPIMDAQGELILDEEVDLTQERKPLAVQSVVFSTRYGGAVNSKMLGREYDEISGVVVMRDISLVPGGYAYQVVDPSPFNDQVPIFRLKKYGTWGEELSDELKAASEKYEENFYKNLPLIADEEVIYRPLRSHEPEGFTFEVRGIYDLSDIYASIDELSYAPLGIYDPPLAELKYDESAQPLPAQTILPGLNPGAVVTRPPLALTNLQGASYLSGQEDYIDAIRVRVVGIEEYSEENLHKVERVASEISERTGLHVDIIAGSSPRDVWVYVPEMGYLEEEWTTLGAVQRITHGINAVNISLMIIFLIVCGVFIALTTNISLMSRIEEVGVLRSVGWRKRDVFRYLLSELIAIGLVGAISAAGFSLLLTRSLGADSSLFSIIGTALAVPLLYTVSGIPAIKRVVQKTPCELLQRGEFSHQHQAEKRPWKKLTFFHFFLTQFSRRKRRNLFTLLTFSTGITLVNLVVNILLNLQGILQVTLLGEFIALRLRNYHFVIVGIALVMGMLVMYENLLLGIRERLDEFKFLHAAGWKKKHISNWIILESVFLSGIGGIIGSTLGTLIFWLLSKTLTTNTLIIFAAGFVVSLLIGWIIAVYPARTIPRRLFLKYEANGKAKKKMRPMLLIALLLVVLGGVIFWAGKGSLIPQSWSSRSTPTEEMIYDQFGIDSAAMMTTIENVSEEGAATLSNSASQNIVAEIVQTFESYGLAIQREWVPLQALTIYNADGVGLDTIYGADYKYLSTAGENSRLIAIASHLGNLQEYVGKRFPLLYKTEDGHWPTTNALKGKILLVDEDFYVNAPLDQGIGAALVQNADLSATAFTVSTDLTPEMKDMLASRADLFASVTLGEAVSGVIHGKDHPEKEIWVISHYESSLNSPGADQSASSIATVLELARLFANDPPACTVRFILLPGQESIYSGLITYLQLHAQETSRVVAAFDIAWTGNWERLLVSEYLEEMESSVDTTRMEKEGQYFVEGYWSKFINLDEEDVLENFTLQTTRRMGLSESPAALKAAVKQAGKTLDIPISSSLEEWYFPTSLPILLSDDLPAIGIYGVGNEMLGSEYDDLSTIQEEDLVKVTALIYQSIQNVIGEEK
ncbi:MAG TPA: hypothetical protein DCK95_01065 [Anaerolineaceae bacterium]|uniref:FtsX-like permease family protein n=1 Tax=Anaerolinea thermophila TaxID=167964 RepID=A0A117LH20_9CHLR|nr:MAG: Uncharacterized protein XD73_0294 [Anaerolinea thermophila]HAF60899.1 hypothetical protein [Anaerolineaceae bacterium]